MLNRIYIKNFALISELEHEFGPRFNVITGETGAGKSIIVDALMIALGGRAGADFVRSGEKKAIAEAAFDVRENREIAELLSEHELLDDSDEPITELILRREITDKGQSRCFVNDSPVSAAIAKQFGALLVDFHGQHDHQELLDKSTHIKVLDNFAGTQPLLDDYSKILSELKNSVAEYTELRRREAELKSKEEAERFELAEIEKVAPEAGEEEKLAEELNLMENAETILSLANGVYENLYDAEDSVHDRLNQARKSLSELAAFDSKFEPYATECREAVISIAEIAKFAKDYASDISFEPNRLDEILLRLQQIKGLRKRYGTFEAIVEREEQLRRELSLIENFDTELRSMEARIDELKLQLGTAAAEITNIRKKEAIRLEGQIVEKLRFLGIANSRFKVRIAQMAASQGEAPECVAAKCGNSYFNTFANGVDAVEFLISANVGEQEQPLADTASGGEISRIMLAIKSILAQKDQIPTLVFDEIDSGISGAIARKTGLTMLELSESHQIISITHLPQIASLSTSHISVSKYTDEGRTFVRVSQLGTADKEREVARLLSGDSITEATLESAKELIATM